MPSDRERDPASLSSSGRRRMPWLISLLVLAAFLPVLWLVNSRTTLPHPPGPIEGRLAGCPESPNCVSSQSESLQSKVEPLSFTESPEAALDRLASVLAALPRTRLVQRTEDYLHVEFRTRICRFVDDVECLVDRPAKVIHVRSASRLGYSDLGANRQRVESIRSRWSSSATIPGTPP